MAADRLGQFDRRFASLFSGRKQNLMIKTFWIENLGCPKNEVDGEIIQGSLLDCGYRTAEDKAKADVLVLNTCGFIQPAKEESLQEIFNLVRLKAQYAGKKIIVCGCLAQRYPNELWKRIPEIDGILGIGEIGSAGAVCRSVLNGERVLRVGTPESGDGIKGSRRNPKGRPFAYVKIADGCDNRCSYCAIPAIRGSFRSKKPECILEEARQLAEQGVREINLVAQDTTTYGVDLYGRPELPELLASLSRIPELTWIRLLYAHPAHFTEELIDQIAVSPKVCKYVDLPLQHISDEILKRMNRKVTRKKVEQLILRLRERIPGLSLRTSFIVGFPGEREKHFQELLRFVEQVEFDKLGAFSYSREEGTKAYELKGQVSSKIKQDRLDRLMMAQQSIAFRKNRDKIGKTISVLIEGRSPADDHRFVGRSQAEAPEVDGTILVKGQGTEIGQVIDVKITKYDAYDLEGSVLG
jgi:ribosomal protein S12 methylthiotransferase